jgi:uracil-DNA glycosylase
MYRTPNGDRDCNKCNLQTGKAVHSHCLNKFSKAILVVYSDYPGQEEERNNQVLFPSPQSHIYNAGKFFRETIDKVMEDSDIPITYKPITHHILMGNVIRCLPFDKEERKNKEISNKHILACKDWVNKDLSIVNPNVPILLSGSKAVTSFFGDKAKIKDLRRTILYYESHPVVVCNNFIEGSRYSVREVKTFYKRRTDGITMPRGPGEILEPIIGDPKWCLIQDLLLVKSLVENYVKSYTQLSS